MDVRGGEDGPLARTPSLPVRCVENANGLRAGSSAGGKVMSVEIFLCPLGSSGGEYGRPVEQRRLLLGVIRLELVHRAVEALHTTTRAGKES
jgi:hypothetical protein